MRAGEAESSRDAPGLGREIPSCAETVRTIIIRIIITIITIRIIIVLIIIIIIIVRTIMATNVLMTLRILLALVVVEQFFSNIAEKKNSSNHMNENESGRCQQGSCDSKMDSTMKLHLR